MSYIILAAGWLFWSMPFFLIKRNKAPAQVIDRRARWGILLLGVAYAMLWQGKFWAIPLPAWRAVLAVGLFVPAALLSWTGAQALGRQWRFDAGVNADHELVTRGPYRVVRHPIYSSMLCMFLGTGCLVTPPLPLLAATLVFILGTEIRVRVEEPVAGVAFRRSLPGLPTVRAGVHSSHPVGKNGLALEGDGCAPRGLHGPTKQAVGPRGSLRSAD